MTKIDDRVDEILAKHPSLTKPEAIKIVTEKNERKKKKRAEKNRTRKCEKAQERGQPPRASVVLHEGFPEEVSRV